MGGRLLILGAGGHGRVVADAALDLGFGDVGFLDDGNVGASSGPFAVIGAIRQLEGFREQWPTAIAAVGNNLLRLGLYNRLKNAGFQVPPVIHPSAVISSRAIVGEGVFIAAGAVVNIGATLGVACIINTGATVDHDCVIGDGAHISPGAHLAGEIFVGDRAWIGIGSSIRNRVRIGQDAIVGAGSAVVRDIPQSETFAGAPARRLRSH